MIQVTKRLTRLMETRVKIAKRSSSAVQTKSSKRARVKPAPATEIAPQAIKQEEQQQQRCGWAKAVADANYAKYHDEEWGVPLHDDRLWFEFIILEGAQAGLSWSTILNKRASYREAYHNFDAAKVAAYTKADEERLLANAGIVRNKLKVAASIANAKAFLQVQKEFGSFDAYVWGFVPGRVPLQGARKAMSDIPTKTAESDALSKDLLQRGFKFVGSTICYALMQATGLVNDHEVKCFRHDAVKTMR
eukprot:TRINITY_DN4224_c0_g1_i2.p1 TRINITY_DN4224_c0_g1~~TRINITY_DN4224_c0_g1_i2.p1  ORF type:complete len:248 (+),score=74.75 TRINITY_DN4224_c0_g1_i2:123-866(+)